MTKKKKRGLLKSAIVRDRQTTKVNESIDVNDMSNKDFLALMNQINYAVRRDAYGLVLFRGNTICAMGDGRMAVIKTKLNINAAVMADKLLNVAKQLPNGNVSLIAKNKSLDLRVGGFKASFLFASDDKVNETIGKLDKINTASAGKYKPLPNDFVEGLFLCLFSADKPAASNYSFLCLDGKDCFSTDNYRVSWYKFSDTIFDEKTLLSVDAVADLLEACSNAGLTGIKKTESWVFFKSGDSLFGMMRGFGDFPDTAKAFNKKSKNMKYVELPNMTDAIKRVSVIEDSPFLFDKHMKMSFSNNNVTLECQTKETGKTQEIIDITGYEDEPFSIVINPIFLLAVLRHSTTMTYFDGMHQVQFDSGAFKHQIMLHLL